jgi:hypothetical protein
MSATYKDPYKQFQTEYEYVLEYPSADALPALEGIQSMLTASGEQVIEVMMDAAPREPKSPRPVTAAKKPALNTQHKKLTKLANKPPLMTHPRQQPFIIYEEVDDKDTAANKAIWSQQQKPNKIAYKKEGSQPVVAAAKKSAQPEQQVPVIVYEEVDDQDVKTNYNRTKQPQPTSAKVENGGGQEIRLVTAGGSTAKQPPHLAVFKEGDAKKGSSPKVGVQQPPSAVTKDGGGLNLLPKSSTVSSYSSTTAETVQSLGEQSGVFIHFDSVRALN